MGFKKTNSIHRQGEKRGLGTTLHLALTSRAVVNYRLFPAQRQDCKTIEEVWQEWPWETIDFVGADKGYDSRTVRSFIKPKNATPLIPLKGVYLPQDSPLTPEDFYDIKLYRTRHIIERLFGRLKENKLLAVRFHKLDSTFISFIPLALTKSFHLLC